MVDGFKRKIIPGRLGGIKGKVEGFWPKPNVVELDRIAGWMQEGKVKAVVDHKFTFEEAPEAFKKLKTGRTRGKIVVNVASRNIAEGTKTDEISSLMSGEGQYTGMMMMIK